MTDIVIIADDLTGANDAGAQLARQGFPTAVSPFWDGETRPLDPQSTVWVFNTESRHCPPDEAARRVAAVAAFAKACGARLLYKKTDSVLRGPVGAELEAVSNVWNRPVIYVPAFPAAGRTVRDGHLFVDGIPLNKTAFANDPLAPVTTASIAGRLGIPLRTVSLRQLRSGNAGFQGLENVVMVEGETEEDLRRTAELAVQQSPVPACWAGPAAFAVYLPAILGLPVAEPPPARCSAPILLVNGSMHPASIAQKDCAIEKGFVPVELVEDDFEAAPAIEALKAGHNTALFHRRIEGDAAESINRRLTAATTKVLKSAQPGTLLLFGGETSQTVLRAVRSNQCRIVNQIDWGAVIMEASTPFGTLTIVTKSGGFGAPDFIERILP